VISQFLESCIERQPDIFLTEMQDQLQEICGVDISISTISRTIRRRGFTRKKIHPCYILMYFQHDIVRLHAQPSNAMKMTALPTRCLWGNISGQSTLYLQMNVISTDFLFVEILHGLLVE
jgi:hypothetical protein